MNIKTSLIIALILGISSITAWELYWRSQGYKPDMDEDKFLWARTRARVEKATSEDVVLIGSSRVLFNIQIYKWEEMTGVKPIQLANAGASPLPVFHDIVENTDFNGTVVVGVTPGLFFSTTYEHANPWRRSLARVNFYKDQTYAQKLNHLLSLPLQQSFVFVSNDEEEWADDINLKALLNTIKLDKRTNSPDFPPFYKFQDIDAERNLKMKERMVTDTAFANSVKKVWYGFLTSEPKPPPPDKEGTTAYFLKDLEKFKARGGTAILLRSPSDGFFADLESNAFSRELFWDQLVQKAKTPAYHYRDYEGLNAFETVEWSHLSAEDANQFTENFVKILAGDNLTSTLKTN
jgi:hypothetical protein